MVLMDHNSLCYLKHLTNPCIQLVKWIIRLQEFDIEVEYKSGKTLIQPNCFSTNHQPFQKAKSDVDSEAFVFALMSVDMAHEQDADILLNA